MPTFRIGDGMGDILDATLVKCLIIKYEAFQILLTQQSPKAA